MPDLVKSSLIILLCLDRNMMAGKLGRAWVGAWVCAWLGAWVYGGVVAPTHALPSLPVVPDPNPTPPNQGTSGLHDTAADYF